MACILSELYMGELLFDTHEDLEHIAMIEKQCGTMPICIAKKCHVDSINKHLLNSGSARDESQVAEKGMRFKWPEAARNEESILRVQEMVTIDQFVLEEFGADHLQFKSLLKYMLNVCPEERPTASLCLKHPFFQSCEASSQQHF
jgi:serine/threonine protein kinase